MAGCQGLDESAYQLRPGPRVRQRPHPGVWRKRCAARQTVDDEGWPSHPDFEVGTEQALQPLEALRCGAHIQE